LDLENNMKTEKFAVKGGSCVVGDPNEAEAYVAAGASWADNAPIARCVAKCCITPKSRRASASFFFEQIQKSFISQGEAAPGRFRDV
jgi:hypothetical protein